MNMGKNFGPKDWFRRFKDGNKKLTLSVAEFEDLIVKFGQINANMGSE